MMALVLMCLPITRTTNSEHVYCIYCLYTADKTEVLEPLLATVALNALHSPLEPGRRVRAGPGKFRSEWAGRGPTVNWM